MFWEADGSISSEEIVLFVIKAKGINAADKAMYETTGQRVVSRLRRLLAWGTPTTVHTRGAHRAIADCCG